MNPASSRVTPVVGLVDDDESVRESLPALLRSFGLAVRAFSSAEAFLASDALTKTDCLILDIAMPGMSGQDLQRELAARGNHVPIVFITAYEDDDVRREVLNSGAVGYLLKPFGKEALVGAIRTALDAR